MPPRTVAEVVPSGRGRPEHCQSPHRSGPASPARPAKAPPLPKPRPQVQSRLRLPPSRGGAPGPAYCWCCSAVFIMELAPRICLLFLPLLLLLGPSIGRFGQKMYQWPVPSSLSRDESLLVRLCFLKHISFPLCLWTSLGFLWVCFLIESAFLAPSPHPPFFFFLALGGTVLPSSLGRNSCGKCMIWRSMRFPQS